MTEILLFLILYVLLLKFFPGFLEGLIDFSLVVAKYVLIGLFAFAILTAIVYCL